MKMTKKNKGFTLVELLAVLLVLAILAVITIPIVVGIISKSRQSTYQRNIETYGKAVEDAVDEYIMDHPEDESKIYTSTEDVVTISKLKEEGILDLKGVEVYCGNDFSFNSESHRVTFFKKCKVNNVSTEFRYTNGKVAKSTADDIDVYEVGEEVKYKGISFRVISKSKVSQNYVTLLKEKPLSYEEVKKYGSVGTSENVVNKYTRESSGEVKNINGFGGMVYYSSEMCGYVNNSIKASSCTTNFDESDIKKVIDAWGNDMLKDNDLEEVNGYKIRLMMLEDFRQLGYSQEKNGTTINKSSNSQTPNWLYNDNYSYWTMSSYEDSSSAVWNVSNSGNLVGDGAVDAQYGVFYLYNRVVRPVINLKRSAIK